MKQVVWTEEYVDLMGCGDPECCGSNYWRWLSDSGEVANDKEDAIRTTAQEYGMKDAFEWQTPQYICSNFLKDKGVELVFVEEDVC